MSNLSIIIDFKDQMSEQLTFIRVMDALKSSPTHQMLTFSVTNKLNFFIIQRVNMMIMLAIRFKNK